MAISMAIVRRSILGPFNDLKRLIRCRPYRFDKINTEEKNQVRIFEG